MVCPVDIIIIYIKIINIGLSRKRLKFEYLLKLYDSKNIKGQCNCVACKKERDNKKFSKICYHKDTVYGKCYYSNRNVQRRLW